MIGDHGHFFLSENNELVSQHSVDVTCNITIGDNVYIGNSTIFNLGVSICDNIIVGSGHIGSRSITDSGFYTGTPIVKELTITN
jgi:acetyltransferase-like isoleucine patch superfamily enzyme